MQKDGDKKREMKKLKPTTIFFSIFFFTSTSFLQLSFLLFTVHCITQSVTLFPVFIYIPVSPFTWKRSVQKITFIFKVKMKVGMESASPSLSVYYMSCPCFVGHSRVYVCQPHTFHVI